MGELRHTRQIMLRQIGGAGQGRLSDSRVTLVGAGGLGGPAALYLAAAGVGSITLVDPDVVEDSNLQRQVQFMETDIAHDKVEALAARLRALDGNLSIIAKATRLTADNAHGLLRGSDVVLDGTDNFDTRFTVNAACLTLGIPLVSGAVAGFAGQVGVFTGRPCYRCFVADAPKDAADCETVGIVGAVAGVVGSVMAMEAIKTITGAGQTLAGRLWLYDGLSAGARVVALPPDPACPECGGG